jgi:hypothetical protein
MAERRLVWLEDRIVVTKIGEVYLPVSVPHGKLNEAGSRDSAEGGTK